MNDVPTPPADHILVVEDDPIGGRQLARFLRSFGYQVTLVGGQAAALEQLARQPFQGVIIDLTLTDGDGYGVLDALHRQDPCLPTICTTGRCELSARVKGLKAGFDHYLPKPFEPLELEALLAAVLRRRRLMEARHAAPQSERTPERWQVMTHERCLKLDGTLRIPLSDIELRFLTLLHDEAPATVARDAIIRVLGRPENLYTRARLDTAISRLRHKIATVADQPAPFTSVYGTGYVWVQRPAAAQPPRVGPEPGKNSSELV